MNKLCIFTLFVGFKLHAAIPQAIEEHLQRLRPLSDRIPAYYTPQQRNLALQRMADLLIQKFFQSIFLSKSKATFTKEKLYKYLQKDLGSATRDTTKSFAINNNTKKWLASSEIASIKDSFNGQLNGNILTVAFRDEEVPIKIEDASEELKLIIDGIAININGNSETQGKCLDMSIDKNKETLNIHWVGTFHTACPFINKRQGKILLELAEAIAVVLHLKKMALSDDSHVFCLNTNDRIDLRTLKIFQTGKSWYEKRGFKLVLNDQQREQHNMDIIKFRNYDINKIKKEINDVNYTYLEAEKLKYSKLLENTDKVRSHDYKNIQAKINYYNNFEEQRKLFIKELKNFKKEHDNKNLSEFMTWLNKKDCHSYSLIYNLLFPDFEQAQPFSFSVPHNPRLVKIVKDQRS
jgi:hypothetical protein